MSAVDKNNVVRDLAALRDQYRPKPPGGTGGGRGGGSGGGAGEGTGGGTPRDPTDARILALEAGQKAILDKLAEIGKSIDASRLDNEKRFSAIDIKLNAVDAKVENKASSETLTRIAGEIGARIVSIEGKIDAKSAATDVATLKGAVEKLPTTIQLAGFILAVFVAAGVAKHFGW